MKSTSEKGHAKNTANFRLLITQIEALGAAYNPSNPYLILPQLQAIYTAALQWQNEVNAANGPYAEAVANRENLFYPLSKLTTKLKKAYKSTEGIEENQLENFMTIARKIKGERKTKANSENQHSTSQVSYDQRTNNLDKLIVLLQNTPNYNPNETEFKIETLRDLYNQMMMNNQEVNQKFVPLNNARSKRNDVFYRHPNNLVDIAHKAKDYLFTILDTHSEQYKSIAKIKFNKNY
jgi:hypothetical protein